MPFKFTECITSGVLRTSRGGCRRELCGLLLSRRLVVTRQMLVNPARAAPTLELGWMRGVGGARRTREVPGRCTIVKAPHPSSRFLPTRRPPRWRSRRPRPHASNTCPRPASRAPRRRVSRPGPRSRQSAEVAACAGDVRRHLSVKPGADRDVAARRAFGPALERYGRDELALRRELVAGSRRADRLEVFRRGAA